MSHENDKFKNSRRRQKDENAVTKQQKISKQYGIPVEQGHRLHKRHAMDCGNPECYMCGNPRKTHKDKLTAQEKKLFQDIDSVRDRHSNGLVPNDKDRE